MDGDGIPPAYIHYEQSPLRSPLDSVLICELYITLQIRSRSPSRLSKLWVPLWLCLRSTSAEVAFVVVPLFILLSLSAEGGRVQFVIPFGAVCYPFCISAYMYQRCIRNPDTSLSYQRNYIVSAMYQRCISKLYCIILINT